MNFKKIVLLISVLAPLALQASFAYLGETGVEYRVFDNDSNSQTDDYNTAGIFRLELNGDQARTEEKVRAFIRHDTVNPNRDVISLEEAWVGILRYPFQIRVGTQLLTWTALEAFHPADVLNSRNYDSPLENTEKFGEPMVLVTYLMNRGTISMMLMPFVIDPKYPNSHNRLSPEMPLPLGGLKFIDTKGDIITNHVALQGAIRADYTLGNADLSVHVIHHQDRSQPVMTVVGTSISPIFLPVTQVGGTVQYAIQDVLLKSEWAFRNFKDAIGTPYGDIHQYDHAEIAVGGEYTIYHDSGHDSTFILEYQTYQGVSSEARQTLGMFQNDVLLGHRFVFNDIQSKEFFSSLIFDLDTENTFLFNIHYEQRLKDQWKFKTGLRLFNGDMFKNSDHIFGGLSYYF